MASVPYRHCRQTPASPQPVTPDGLLRSPGAAPTQVIAVTSGKGGAGKTTAAINLATALANRGHGVMLLDGDTGLADLEVALGLHPAFDLGHVLAGRIALEDILLPGPSGISVVPAAAASAPGSTQQCGGIVQHDAAVISAFESLTVPPDVLVIDTAAGIADGVLRYAQAASEVLVVLGPEPTAQRNAHALIRALNESAGLARFRVLVNRVGDREQACELFHGLVRSVDAELGVALHLAGCIPDDPRVTQALKRQLPLVNAEPQAPAAQAFKQLARRVENWRPPALDDGRLSFFTRRLHAAQPDPWISLSQGREVA